MGVSLVMLVDTSPFLVGVSVVRSVSFKMGVSLKDVGVLIRDSWFVWQLFSVAMAWVMLVVSVLPEWSS